MACDFYWYSFSSFVIVGALLSNFVETKILEISLALFLIAVSLVHLTFKYITLKINNSNSIIGRTFSGLFAGLVGTGGTIKGIALGAYYPRMDVFTATLTIIDLAIDSFRSFVYFLNGHVRKYDLYVFPILPVVSISGTYIEKKS